MDKHKALLPVISAGRPATPLPTRLRSCRGGGGKCGGRPRPFYPWCIWIARDAATEKGACLHGFAGAVVDLAEQLEEAVKFAARGLCDFLCGELVLVQHLGHVSLRNGD